MRDPLLAADRVLLLLALVPYLDEHGPTPVPELARAFDVDPELVRRLVRFLGTAGVPGETLSYQHEDLFDIDWDGLERDDVVSLTRTVAVDDAPRFAPAETAALVAGLQALIPLLPDDDAALARSTAERLADALGVEPASAGVTVTAPPADERLPRIVRAIEAGEALGFDYVDAAGAGTSRVVDPLALVEEAGAWYLRAWCRDRRAERTFRVDAMRALRAAGPAEPHPAAGPDPDAAPDAEPAPESGGAVSAAAEGFEVVAALPPHALPRIAGFDPELLEAAPGAPGGPVRARIAAWRPASVLRLVQLAQGELVVESPAAAREAVRAWAERALAAYGE